MIYKSIALKNKKFCSKNLEQYGFSRRKEGKEFYFYTTKILDNSFELIIRVFPDDTIDTKLIETAFNEEYNPVYISCAEGEFVGKVKNEFENVLNDIIEKCTEQNIFKSYYAKDIIQYVEKTYNDKPEYLWEKFPNNAVFRNNDKKGKWYAAILTVKAAKLGFESDEEIEVINLKAEPDEILKMVDNKIYFPAYHMNKKHWYTICLTNPSITLDKLYKHIERSYTLLK